MSTLGKIVTVLIVLASVAVAVFTLSFVWSNQDWHGVAMKQADANQKLVNSLESMKAALAARNDDVARIKLTATAEKRALEATVANLKSQMQAVQEENRSQATRQNELENTIKGLQKSLEQAQAEMQNWKTAYEQSDAKAGQLLDDNQSLTKRNQDMRRTLDDLRDKVRRLEQQNADLARRTTYLEQTWPGGEVPTSEVAVLPTVDLTGRVLAVDNGMGVAEISLGSSDKVVEGTRFVVSRSGEYVADVIVTKVDENRAVGRLETTQKNVQEGDNVTYTVRR